MSTLKEKTNSYICIMYAKKKKKPMYGKGGMTAMLAKYMMGGMMPKYKKGGFPDLTGDGKVTFADILKGRGVSEK